MTNNLSEDMEAAATALPLPDGDLHAVMVRAGQRSQRRRRMVAAITLLTAVVACAGGLSLLVHNESSLRTEVSSVPTESTLPASYPRFASTSAWQEMGDRIVAEKRAKAADPNGMYPNAVNFGFGAFQSKPIDVTAPAEYELQFGPINGEFGSPPAPPPGFSLMAPPDMTFRNPKPFPKGYITDETGTYFVMTIRIEEEGFSGPYPGFRMWMV